MKVKYMEISDLNNDQAKLIVKHGWCVFTECDEGGSYYNKGFSWVNRIGYIILSEVIEPLYLGNFNALNAIAEYDEDFSREVNDILKPIEDKCYVYLVKEPQNYHFEQIWTNKGFEESQKIAKVKFKKSKYYKSEDYDKMDSLIHRHNQKVKEETEQAKQLLEQNGFKVFNNFVAVKKK